MDKKILDDATALDLIVKGSRLGLCLIDKGKRIVWANSIFEGWFGSLEELKARYCYEIYEDDGKRRPADKVFEAGGVQHSMREAVTKEGKSRWFKLMLTAVKGGD